MEAMARLRNDGPYVWVTWLPKLLSGESTCEWESWFKAHHDGNSWARMPSGFDVTQWLMNHTALLNQSREGILRADGGPEPLQPQGDFSSAGR